MQLEFFSAHEFACQCCRCHLGMNEMNEDLLELLDAARERAGVAFGINSAVRCAEHNEACGGRPGSAHLSGHAVDIAVPSSQHRFKILRALFDVGFERIGVYRTFIHVDCDPSKAPEVCWYL